MAWNRRQFLLGISAGVGGLWAARSGYFASALRLAKPGPRLIKILVGASSRLDAELLAEALKYDRSLHAVGATAGSREFFELAVRHPPDIAVLFDDDMHLGLSALKEFRAAYPQIPVILVWSGSPMPITPKTLPWGAREVLGIHESPGDLIECIHAIHEGCPLTRRERKILPLLCQGLTHSQISMRLGLAEHAVRAYTFRIFDKLGVSSRLELVCLLGSNPKYQRMCGLA
jgi:DNA-binding NarL/FixJ family response regulator